jgi:uncharacterized protein YdeI (YjbR/CyaY-like superfamily)
MMDLSETLFCPDRDTWRAWLAEQGAAHREVWLLFYKKHTGRPGLEYEEAVEEALCFGWIDGQLRRIDDEKHAIRFTPRRPGSVWAESNKVRVARMIEQGRMTEAGMALVRDAQKNGEWGRAADREDTITLPSDLEAAFAENRQARRNFLSFPASSRKQYLYWVSEAKREETRRRRIAEVVKRAEENRRTWR